jgi:hypothetical protein
MGYEILQDKAEEFCGKDKLACLVFARENVSIDYAVSISDEFLGTSEQDQYNHLVHIVALLRSIADKITQDIHKNLGEDLTIIKTDIAESYYELQKKSH